MSKPLKPASQPLLLALVFGVLIWRESHETWFAPVQRGYVAWLQGNASSHQPKRAPLLLVEINDGAKSGDADERRGTWQPVDFAIALNTILPLQPEVLAIAPVLTWSGEDAAAAPDQDQYLRVLHDKLLAARKPLLAARLGLPDDPDLAPPIEAVPAVRNVSGEMGALPEYPVIAEKADSTLRLAGATGFLPPQLPAANQPIALLFRYHGQIVPSFILQAVLLHLGITLDEVKVSPGAIQIGRELRIPVDAAGQLMPDSEVAYDRMGFDDLMLGVTKMQAGQASQFRAGARKQDIVLLARPGGSAAGVPIADAIATILTRSFPHPLGLFWEALCLLPACLLAAWTSGWSRERTAFAILLASIGYTLVALSVYGAFAIVIPLLAPIAILLLGLVLALGRRTV